MDILLAFPATLLAIALVAVSGPGLRDTCSLSVLSASPSTQAHSPVDGDLNKTAGICNCRYWFGRRAQIASALQAHASKQPAGVSGCSYIGVAQPSSKLRHLGFSGWVHSLPFPAPEWGREMLADSYQYLTSGSWWVLTFPGLCIVLTVLGFNLVGDGLRDALDPSLTS